MPTSREPRKSEKALTLIWALLPHLQVCTWYPIIDDAIEYAEQMKMQLDVLIEELKAEKAAKNNG